MLALAIVQTCRLHVRRRAVSGDGAGLNEHIHGSPQPSQKTKMRNYVHEILGLQRDFFRKKKKKKCNFTKQIVYAGIIMVICVHWI